MGNLASNLDCRTMTIARMSLLRSVREPKILGYVSVPLVLFVEPIVVAIESSVTAETMALALLYGAWAAGAAFSLDPLGSEGPLLPVSLTTGCGGRSHVDGRAIAGIALIAPLTLLTVSAIGIRSSLSAFTVVKATIVAAALCASTPYVAAWTGVLFPGRIESKITSDGSIPVPSKIAFACYSALVVALAFPAVVSLSIGVVDPSIGLSCTFLLSAAAAVISRRRAARAIDSYRL